MAPDTPALTAWWGERHLILIKHGECKNKGDLGWLFGGGDVFAGSYSKSDLDGNQRQWETRSSAQKHSCKQTTCGKRETVVVVCRENDVLEVKGGAACGRV